MFLLLAFIDILVVLYIIKKKGIPTLKATKYGCFAMTGYLILSCVFSIISFSHELLSEITLADADPEGLYLILNLFGGAMSAGLIVFVALLTIVVYGVLIGLTWVVYAIVSYNVKKNTANMNVTGTGTDLIVDVPYKDVPPDDTNE